MSEPTNWTLEVRPAGDDDNVREITLDQLRKELSAGTVAPGDEVRSTFALDGKWRTASDIESLSTSMAKERSMPAHTPFVVASIGVSFAYAAIMGANALPTRSTLALWLLMPIISIAGLAFFTLQNRPPFDRMWPAAAAVALAAAVSIGMVLDANWLGSLLVIAAALSLLASAFAARAVSAVGGDPAWRSLCAFAIPLSTFVGAGARSLSASVSGGTGDMAGLIAFVTSSIVLPLFIYVRFRKLKQGAR